MLQTLKDHTPHIVQSVQSAFDAKSATAAALTVGSGVTAVTVEANNALSLNDMSVYAAIFAASCTGAYMLSNFILNLIKIYRAFKDDDKCD